MTEEVRAPAAASGVTALSSASPMEPASGLHPDGLQSAGAVRDIILAKLDGVQMAFILRMKPHRLDQRITKVDWEAVEPCVDSGLEYPDVYWFGGMRAHSGAGSRRWRRTFRFNEVGLEVRAVLASAGMRVARSLHGKLFATITDWRDELGTWEQLPDHARKAFLHAALAAVDAMREPPASVDTHAKRGDAAQTAAPSRMSGAVPEGQTPNLKPSGDRP